jgi:heterodisulfide reductase subunit C1
MGKLYNQLNQDIRFIEGFNGCMNCGVCTAICPAAEFYNYDPRIICDTVQSKDEKLIEVLLRSETIWYCGECMSCKTRCPQNNTPGFVIMALRKLSQELGYFTDSEKGRQQFAIKRAIGENILRTGYCVHPDIVSPQMHPELGPVWDWTLRNITEIMGKMGSNYKQEGPGGLRTIAPEVLEEISRIFEVTGCKTMFDTIEKHSKNKADELGIEISPEGTDNEYFMAVYTENSEIHNL